MSEGCCWLRWFDIAGQTLTGSVEGSSVLAGDITFLGEYGNLMTLREMLLFPMLVGIADNCVNSLTHTYAHAHAHTHTHSLLLFLSFCRVLNVNYSFLGNSPASEF